MRARTFDLATADPVPVGELGWIPVRRTLGARGFGVNGWSAGPGEEVIETHTEDPEHQELYLVVRGRARFRSDDETFEAGPGTLVFYPEGTITRGAEALEAGTLVLAIGGNVDAPYEPAAWEHWYVADAHSAAGEHEKAAAVLAAGLTEHPDHPALHLHLACALAQAGRVDDAAGSLHRALEIDRSEVERRARAYLWDELEPLRSRGDWPL